ncbi:MAG: hypothetical protein QXF97_07245 [Candidatus Caldarchaeum sp.]
MNEENAVVVEVKVDKRLFQLLQALSLLDGCDDVGRWLNNRLKDVVAADLDYLGLGNVFDRRKHSVARPSFIS